MPNAIALKALALDPSATVGQGQILEPVYGPWLLRQTKMRLRKLLLGDSIQLVIALIGDSYTQGTTYYAQALATSLQNVYGLAGVGWIGFGWWGTASGTWTTTAQPTGVDGSVRPDLVTVLQIIGTWTCSYNVASNNTPSLSKITSSTAGDYVRFTVHAGHTSANLFYTGDGTGVIKVSWDDGNTWSGNLSLSTAGAASVALTGIPSGATTARIQVVSGNVALAGVDLQSTASGVRVHKLGGSGSATSQWSSVTQATWVKQLQTLAPNLVTVMLAVNDQGASFSPTTTYTTNITTIGNNILAATPNPTDTTPFVDVLLMGPPENQRTTNTYPMRQYTAAQRAVAVANNFAFLDFQYYFGSDANFAYDYAFANPSRPWYQSNLVHPDPSTGGRAIADALAALLTTGDFAPPTTLAETTGAKLRRLAAIAKDNNAWANNRPGMRSVKPWQPSTAYKLNSAVVSGGNLYFCAVAGTTAASGGPTGTGNTLITDNTASWAYFGPNYVTSDPQTTQTAWAASTAYTLGQQVTANGKVYGCVVAGTSTTGSGPTGTTNTVIDGTVTWTYMGPVTTNPYAQNWPTYTYRGTSLPASLTNSFAPNQGSGLYLKRVFLGSGGSGYVVGDTILLGGGAGGSNGTFTTQAQLQVTSVSSGVITGLSILNAGSYSVIPAPSGNGTAALAQASTSGVGTGATFYAHFSNAGWFTLRGCYVAAGTGGNFGTNVAIHTFQPSQAGSVPTTSPCAIEFYSDAPMVGIQLGSNAPLGATLIIDGVRYNLDSLDYPASATNYYTWDFSTTTGRKPRLYRLEFSVAGTGSLLFNVYTDSASNVWAPPDTDRVTAVSISDEFWVGSIYGPFMLSNQMALRMAAELGWNDPWDFSTKLTGWGNAGSGAGTTTNPFGNRIAEALTLNNGAGPDVWVFTASDNDSAYVASLATTVKAALGSIRTGGSKAPIIVFGCLPTSATSLTIENAVSSGVSSYADPLGKTFFIPLYNRPSDFPMITGSFNNSPLPSGITNTNANNSAQYINSGELNDLGTQYAVRWMANRIRQDVLGSLA